MNKTWVVALSLGVAWAPALQAAAPVAAVEEGQFLPGEFVITFQPGAHAELRTENGVVVTGVKSVDALNKQYGVYAAVPAAERGTYRFKVPAKTDIREAVAAYRALTEPVRTASGILAGSRDLRDAVADGAIAQPKQQLRGVLLAANVGASNPGALFEGQVPAGNALVVPLVLREQGPAAQKGLLQPVACNPNIEDCPAAPAAPSRSNCNPNLEDCPGSSQPRRQNPAPARRAPGQVTCTPGVDPGCGGAPVDTRPPEPTRPPMNWTTRPTLPPSSWSQPGSSVEYLRSVPSNWWYPVGGAWFPVTSMTGYSSYGTASATIERGGRDTGKGQSSSYTKTFRTTSSADKYQLYYSRVGYNCQDYQGDRYCERWGVDYRWIWAGSDSRSREATIDVRFNDKPLLPWESESFTFYFNGDTQQVSSRVDVGNGSYNYSVAGPNQNFATGRAEFTITAGDKRQTAADANAVSAGIELRNGKVWLVVHDKRAEFYKGEPLDVAIKVMRQISCKNGSTWHDLWCNDSYATVFESKTNDQPFPKLRIAIPSNVPANQVFAGPVTAPAGCNPNIEDCKSVVGVNIDQGSGRYYIETSNWNRAAGQFRRASSAVSTGDWHYASVENGHTEITK